MTVSNGPAKKLPNTVPPSAPDRKPGPPPPPMKGRRKPGHGCGVGVAS